METPFANTDDIRMVPHSFEAVIGKYTGIKETEILAGHIQRWAGYDSGHDISEFKTPAERGVNVNSSGAMVFGAVNQSIENLVIQGWYYGIDNVSDLLYTDVIFSTSMNETAIMEFKGQYVSCSANKDNNGDLSEYDGDIYGLGMKFSFRIGSVGVAYNRSHNDNGKLPPIGLGGGPYFTSMEEWTIQYMEDAKAYQLNAVLDMKDAGIDGLKLTTLYGSFESIPMNAKLIEWDLIGTYEMDAKFSADVSYASIHDQHHNFNAGSDAGYDRFLVRMHYNF